MTTTPAPVYKRSPSIVVYMDDPVSPTFIRAEDNTNRSRRIGASADPSSASAVDALLLAVMARAHTLGTGIVHFGPGQYKYLSELGSASALDGVIIEGEGLGTILDITSSVSAAQVWGLRVGSNTLVRNLTIKGIADLSYPAGGVKFNGDHSSLENVIIDGGAKGISSLTRHGLDFKNVLVKNQHWTDGFADCADFYASYDITIDGFRGETSDRFIEMETGTHHINARNLYALGIDNGHGNEVSPEPFCLDVHSHQGEDACYHIIVDGCTIDACARGITVSGAGASNPTTIPYDIHFRNIDIINPLSTCWSRFSGIKSSLSNCKISRTTPASTPYQSVWLWNEQGSYDTLFDRISMTINGDTTTRCNQLSLFGNYCTVRDSYIERSLAYEGAIQLGRNATSGIGCSAIRCHIVGTSQVGILVQGMKSKVIDCYVDGGGAGGDIYLADGAGAEIIRNNIGTGSHRVTIISPTSYKIQDNDGYDTKTTGDRTGTGAEETFAHGLGTNGTALTPSRAWIYIPSTGEMRGIPYLTTNLLATVDAGVAYTWFAEAACI